MTASTAKVEILKKHLFPEVVKIKNSIKNIPVNTKVKQMISKGCS